MYFTLNPSEELISDCDNGEFHEGRRGYIRVTVVPFQAERGGVELANDVSFELGLVRHIATTRQLIKCGKETNWATESKGSKIKVLLDICSSINTITISALQPFHI
jgi:hypothetical protein